jgi:4-amino-4-deoxy-L-arabinose transferase-like glycosyltransferase
MPNSFSLSYTRLLLLLNIAAIAFFFIIQYQLGFPGNIHENMFFTGDSQEYRDYTNWLTGESDYCNPVRTYFYPLLILISRSLMGETGIWLMQFLFWIIACNLVFLAVRRTTGNRTAAAIVFVLCASNVSVINLTTHGLTEVTVFFFLALIIYFLSRAFTAEQSVTRYMPALLALSMIAVVKPQYMMLWYPSLLLIVIAFRKDLLKAKIIALLIACMLPVLVQVTINKVKHGRYTSTAIGSSNLRLYYYRKVKHVADHGSIESFDAQNEEQHRQEQEESKTKSEKEIYSFLARHPFTSLEVFIDNLRNNMASGHPYIYDNTHPKLSKWTQNINNKFYYLNLYGFLVWLVFCIAKLRSRAAGSRMVIASGILAYYALFTTGLVFWAGDRLIAPAITAWSCCHAIMIVELVRIFAPRIRALRKK